MRIRKIDNKHISLIITVLLFAGLFILGSIKYKHMYFFSLSTFLNLFNDNGYLMVISVGIIFVLLVGGIDISVASTMAFTSVFSAFMLSRGLSELVVIPAVLTIGLGFGALQGFLIQKFELQPFIVTLAGQFFMRGMCSVITSESISIQNPLYKFMNLGKFSFNIKGSRANLYYSVLIVFVVILLGHYILKYTKFGRSVYAVGGNEQSAKLMGIAVDKTKILVYTISGFCSAVGGVLFSFYTLAGYPLQNMGLELDAISSAVIGGTLLTGGVGAVLGSTLGVMIQGVIKNIVTYQSLNPWFTKVAIAGLLFAFMLIQRLLSARSEKSKLSPISKTIKAELD